MNSRKVILTGSFGVGKTAIFKRFTENTFNQKYIPTTKVKVGKKIIHLENQNANFSIWDIPGEINQNKVPKPYFLGTSAVVYIFDITRQDTYKNLSLEVVLLKRILPDVPIYFVANKADLLEVSEIEIFKGRKEFNLNPTFFISAKTGENMPKLVQSLV